MIYQYLYAYKKHVSYFLLLHTVLRFWIRRFLDCGDETDTTNLCIKSFVSFIAVSRKIKFWNCVSAYYCLFTVYYPNPDYRCNTVAYVLRVLVLVALCPGHREGGTMTPGPMGFRGPAHGLQEGRWLQQAQQRAHELERGPSKWPWEISIWGLKTFFFGDHQISSGNTVKISVKTFFFWRSHHNSDKTAAFSPSVLEFTKPKIRHIWAGPGPTFGSRRPWLCHHDKTSGISREMQNASHLKFLQTKKLQ